MDSKKGIITLYLNTIILMLKGIVAMDENRVIGKDGKMPWHYPEDLKNFKEKTQGQICLMGRSTYEGLKQYRPNAEGYPHASKNLVFSRNMEEKPGIEIIHSVDELQLKYGKEIVRVLGGAKTFEILLPYIDEIYETLIPGIHEGDTYMPEMPRGINFYSETLKTTEDGLIFKKLTKVKDNEGNTAMNNTKRNK